MSGRSRPTCIDLFCGAGGLSLGFVAADFDVILAADSQPSAVDTYCSQVAAHACLASISSGMVMPEADVVIGGPPCQGFSSAGQRRTGDSRNSLVSVFAHLVARAKPLAFVFENVEGFLTSEGGRHVMDLLSPLVDVGYRVHVRKINAADYGVPQHRKRVFAIGGLGWDPTFPTPTHRAYGAPGTGNSGCGMPRTPSFGEALQGLPSPAAAEPGDPPDHFTMRLSDRDLERARLLRPGQTMRDLPEGLWHASYRRRAYRRVMDGTPSERRGGAPAGLRRLRVDEPSKAITGGATREFIHPLDDRYLTLRECARLQTFPDEFTFRGTISQRMQLIGNAVPPLLGEQIARQLVCDLQETMPRKRGGRLLSFMPTTATGMSPALQRTTRLVLGEFGVAMAEEGQLTLWP